MNDAVNSPDHYVKNGITLQPIELSNRLDSSLGQAVQYVVRRNDKNTVLENLKKARFEVIWCKDNLSWKKEYQHYCVSKDEFNIYVDQFIRHTKDEFFKTFLTALFKTPCVLTTKPNFRVAIELLDEEIARLEAKEKGVDKEKIAERAGILHELFKADKK